MEVVGSEIGQKMRSAIKAKLTELGCYVDDELPDYVMVMVANKRTRAQMEDDLQLFLGDNTVLFVNWLHQVLKKLQEVTVTAPLKQAELSKEKSLVKEKKHKEKRDKQKSKKSDTKKKKKDKGKSHHKKEGKKSHKSKKKSKHHGIIRPNVPPLLMNIEKESEPSITDVFAGQILKNHGVNVDSLSDISNIVETKPTVTELKRPLLPIIDPASITSQAESSQKEEESSQLNPDVVQIDIDDKNEKDETMELPIEGPREDKLKEMNEIEAKIQGLKQKLTEQLDSMSDDEDFLNIRTEAEELMNDFAEDVFQEISANVSSPKNSFKSPSSISQRSIKLQDIPKEPPKEPVELPQIELNLPKRPVRERLGAKEAAKIPEELKEKATDIRIDSPERFTPEREPDMRPVKSAKSRLGDPPEVRKKSLSDEEISDFDSSSKRLTSKVAQENRLRGSCASVVRVRPRPRVGAPASSLLLRAVADAQKSLMNIPPKPDQEPNKVKRALVLPMRRNVDPQKILIQVGRGETDRHTVMGHDEVDFKDSKFKSDISDSNEEYAPTQITKKIINTDYVPPRRTETRTSTKKDDTLIVETINIHHQTVDKEKNTQFIVTMDGYHLNALLAKKLMTEGLLDEDEDKEKLKEPPKLKEKYDKTDDKTKTESIDKKDTSPKTANVEKKRLSNTSEESDTNVIIEQENGRLEKRKSTDIPSEYSKESPPVKKRKASPIVFSVEKAKDKDKESEKEHERKRTESAGSDNHVTVTTNVNTHKYDAVPPLSATTAERKPVLWCRTFPLCRFGSACAYAHPRCKFAAACTRRNCMYSHAPQTQSAPVVASHVVPAANYKTISAVASPTLCKFYPNCVNPACHFHHPKPCRYGKACMNKLECNFFHSDVPATKWKYPV